MVSISELMTDEEVLKKAIETVQSSERMPANACIYDHVHLTEAGLLLHCTQHKKWHILDSEEDIIFDVTFANALWGKHADYCLHQLAAHKHPLKYIETFLQDTGGGERDDN